MHGHALLWVDGVPRWLSSQPEGESFGRSLIEGGLVLDNPNSPSPAVGAAGAARPPADLSGDVPQRVLQILDQQINPSIAAHGGHAELVAVEGDTAYLRLSGGCQGCGMATVTLSQGIEVAIKEQVPEIARVVDTTDHAVVELGHAADTRVDHGDGDAGPVDPAGVELVGTGRLAVDVAARARRSGIGLDPDGTVRGDARDRGVGRERRDL